ncbi:phosphoribosyl-dephospho-CoA transferase [Scopulibacillus darangshiensis]|uniref:Phosphoribosyl-dephospho-CoA transferase n=2 Tax=Scopulibacillus darangshiensis TaxID=442528 RepID=A0A4R2P9I2_9BACL|nr:phosphoribosyl-dephospho-CoA transferase [Scopulibacillus darangshiensis]
MPHNILQFKHKEDLVSDLELPEWSAESIDHAPFAVIRRAPFKENLVPVGIRGKERNQRFASYLPIDKIKTCISPLRLAKEKAWNKNIRIDAIKALSVLPALDGIISAYGMPWGPTGSIGFELATGMPAAKETSDLDAIVCLPQELPRKKAKRLAEELNALPVPVDVQIMTPFGGVALMEYARGDKPLIMKTNNGPKFVEDPWSEK